MELTSLASHIIKPPATTGHIINLSNNDQIMPRVYTQFLLFFSPPNSGASQDSFSSDLLRSSLAQALEIFYPLAGRFKERSDGGLDVDCNNEGILFFEALAAANLSDFGNFQPNPAFPHLSPCNKTVSGEIWKLPLLLVQITRFKCGGAALCAAMHHNVGDGAATNFFMQAWMEICRHGRTSLKPNFDHSGLKARNPPCPSFQHIEYKLGTPATPSSVPAMTARMIKFHSSSLRSMAAGQGPDQQQTFTRFETLAAHLWKCITKARGIDPSSEVTLGMAVDGRNRTKPSLGDNYFGNANFYACAIANAGELAQQSLHFAATLVCRSISRIDDEYMRSAIDWIELQESPLCIQPGFSSFLGQDLAITSWSRFGMYDMDFGWGKPVFAGVPAAAWDGLVILLPSCENEEICCLIGLETGAMKSLMEDPEFLKPLKGVGELFA